MIISAKCINQKCKAEGKVVLATQLFFAKAGPPNGPFNCPECGGRMTRVEVVPENYKGRAGAKRISRGPVATQEKPKSKPIGKKKRHGMKLKVSGPILGSRVKKQTKKANARKQGPRKRA